MPKHLGEARRSGQSRRAWKVAVPAIAIVGGVAAGLLGVGGSYALWSASASANTGTIQAGTAELQAQWAAGHSDAAWSNLLPGESARQDFALQNTGNAKLEISAATLGVVNGFEVRIVAGACPATPLGTVASNASKAPVGTAAAPATPIVITPGQIVAACLEVRATNATTPGKTVAFETTFEGKQVL